MGRHEDAAGEMAAESVLSGQTVAALDLAGQ